MLGVVVATLIFTSYYSGGGEPPKASGKKAKASKPHKEKKPAKEKKAPKKEAPPSPKKKAKAPVAPVAVAPAPAPEPTPARDEVKLPKAESPKKKKEKKKAAKAAKAGAPAPEAASTPAPAPETRAATAAAPPADDGWTVVDKKADPGKKKKAPKHGAPAADGSVTLDCGRFAAAIIGKGGETIKKLAADHPGATLNVEKSNNGGSTCKIGGDDPKVVAKAKTAAGRGGKSAVVLSGTRDQVAKAKALVLAAMNGVDIAAESTETIELGARGVPLLIGKGGATIKELQAKCGARIDVPRGGTACTVSGSADDVARAVATVKALLEDNGHGETLDLDCHVGVLLGKAGATIRKIQEASGCRVDVRSTGDAACAATLSGSLEQIAAAKREIQGAVDAANAGPALGPGEVAERVAVPDAYVGAVIGKAGANVKKIQDESKAKIDVKDGCCVVYGPRTPSRPAAIRAIVGKQADFDAQRARARRRRPGRGPGRGPCGGAGADGDACVPDDATLGAGGPRLREPRTNAAAPRPRRWMTAPPGAASLSAPTPLLGPS
ncbi:RNA binding-protein [Aureococcus anophagefferens]|nr:RNA binding-protein [Aureococcus anophagefferens]